MRTQCMLYASQPTAPTLCSDMHGSRYMLPASRCRMDAWHQVRSIPLFAIAPSPLLFGVIAAGQWITGPIYNAVQFSYRMALIPDALQGRVNSSFRLLAFGFNPLGAALCGLLLERFGSTPTVLVFAACYLAIAVATQTNPHVRHAAPAAALPAH